MSSDQTPQSSQEDEQSNAKPASGTDTSKEVGGPKEVDPTRYGDWTVKGRCIDF